MGRSVSLWKEATQSILSLPTTWRHNKTSTCKPGRELSPAAEFTGIVILDFSVSRTGGIYVPYLSRPVHGSMLQQPDLRHNFQLHLLLST